MTTTIRLRGPADIITVLPYHLGYRPAESLVVVCLMRNRIGVVGRIDLPPPDVDPDLVAVELLPIVRRERPDAVVLVGFESTHGQAEPASVAMRDAIESAGIRVVERLVVRDGRWWSLDCDRDCCPAEGEPVQTDDEVPAVSDYIVRGRRPAGSRADLAARLAHRPEPEQDRRCAAFINDLATARRSRSALQRRRRRMLQDWARILDLTPSGPDAVAGAAASRRRGLGVGRRLPAGRGGARPPHRVAVSGHARPRGVPRVAAPAGGVCPPAALVRAGPGRPGRPGRRDARAAPVAEDAVEDTVEDAVGEGLVDRLAMVCRAAPPELSPGPLTVLAHVVWWQGDGALARTALDQALAVDPDYRLAALLERMVDVAARPRATA